MPATVPWYYWRVMISGRFPVTLTEIQNAWTIDDLLDAHLMLNALEDAEAERSKARHGA